MVRTYSHFSTALLVSLGSALFSAPVQADREPTDWLNQMGAAVQSTSYEGTVIRIQDGSAEALKVVRTVIDGVILEKVFAQEGNGLEIIRRGDEVHCILPYRKSVLVQEWDNQSILFSSLPASDIRFGNEYDVAVVRKERIAGREAILLAIRPHDGYRYGHRIWLDIETSFPLQTKLISDGETIEQVKFADIALNQEIHASSLEPSYSTEQFTWLREPSGHNGTRVETSWSSDKLPAGFHAIATHEETMAGSDEMVTHIMFSDGLANVSVFIAAKSGELAVGAARVGGSNSFSVELGDHEITAIGEVPAMTVEQIATTMRQL
jgi:sigma-E factor negative regulatory protein RseB